MPSLDVKDGLFILIPKFIVYQNAENSIGRLLPTAVSHFYFFYYSMALSEVAMSIFLSLKYKVRFTRNAKKSVIAAAAKKQ